MYPNTASDSLLSSAYQSSVARYNEPIGLGVKKEDARLVLPAGIVTELNISGNFQAWLDFLRLRTDKAAQWEIRDVAVEIGRQLYNVAPNVFKEYKVEPI